MGLDTTHIHLTLEPNTDSDFLYIDEWDLDCNVSLENYSKYISTIEEYEYNKKIVVVNNDEEYEQLKKQTIFNSSQYLKVFVGESDDKMTAQISKFIAKEKLDNLEISSMGLKIDNIKYSIISFGELTKIKIIYYNDNIGYQRLGMNDLFYEVFKKHLFWGNKEDFELAYTCIDEEWIIQNWSKETLEKLKKDFRKNFLEQFEFGKSLLSVTF